MLKENIRCVGLYGLTERPKNHSYNVNSVQAVLAVWQYQSKKRTTAIGITIYIHMTIGSFLLIGPIIETAEAFVLPPALKTAQRFMILLHATRPTTGTYVS